MLKIVIMVILIETVDASNDDGNFQWCPNKNEFCGFVRELTKPCQIALNLNSTSNESNCTVCTFNDAKICQIDVIDTKMWCNVLSCK